MHRALLAQRYHNLAHGRGPSTARASNLPPDQTSQEQATAGCITRALGTGFAVAAKRQCRPDPL